MSKLIIAEKPSVAKSIASALGASSRADGFYEGSGLIVSWCVGHLVSPLDAGDYDERFKKWRYEDLPILPEPFRYAPIPGKETALDNVKRLMAREDVTEIVNACDAGREGELIFRLVYELAGCRKPVLRLWISSMEDSAIREGFSELRPGAEYEALYQSALCRQRADWLVGINATRLFSVLYHRTLNVGRVQTPTLSLLAARDAKIALFQKEKYHHVRLTLAGAEAVSERFTDPAEAEQAAAMCKGAAVTCTSVTCEQKKEPPPKLYDLTSLQREANRLLGYTAKQTLDYAQSLYEKKLLTYPRTDSRHLTSDMAETASCVIHLAAKLPPFDKISNFYPLVEAMVSDKDVSDHHAIIPTLEIEKADIPALPLGERELLLLVCCRLLCASAEPYVYEAVTAAFGCGGHSFTAKGRRVLSEGWREIDRIFRTFLKEKPADGDGGTLPDFTEGQTFDGAEVAVTEHFTQPPKPYTDDVRRSFTEMYGPVVETRTVYNCYDDAEILRKADMQAAETTERTVVAIGRLTAQKGFDRLLHVWKRLLDEGICCKLRILGEGEDRNMLKAIIEESGLDGTVTLCGFQENPYPMLKNAALYVCSSRYEGFSTTVIESLILGAPVVTTDCTGMREILGDSEYGLIADNTEESLYSAVKRMLTEPGLLEHYAKRADARGKDFRRERLVRETEAFFEKELQKKRRT